jgi:hypothetical protein
VLNGARIVLHASLVELEIATAILRHQPMR